MTTTLKASSMLLLVGFLLAAALVLAVEHQWSRASDWNGVGSARYPVNDCGRNLFYELTGLPDEGCATQGVIPEEKFDRLVDRQNPGVLDQPADEEGVAAVVKAVERSLRYLSRYVFGGS